MTKSDEMKEIEKEVFNLTSSSLYAERIRNKTLPVVGEGSYEAKIMFVGEAPGKNEARTGKPFCGASGRILDKLLESIGVSRSEVYVTNIVKDRPPENRDPTDVEIALYGPFLDRQINIIQPKVIATLGRYSMNYIMCRFGLQEELKPIGTIHGKIFKVRFPFGDVVILPLYHPAVVVYNAVSINVLREDFQQLVSFSEQHATNAIN